MQIIKKIFILLLILIVVVNVQCSSVDWNVKTMESDSEFDDKYSNKIQNHYKQNKNKEDLLRVSEEKPFYDDSSNKISKAFYNFNENGKSSKTINYDDDDVRGNIAQIGSRLFNENTKSSEDNKLYVPDYLVKNYKYFGNYDNSISKHSSSNNQRNSQQFHQSKKTTKENLRSEYELSINNPNLSNSEGYNLSNEDIQQEKNAEGYQNSRNYESKMSNKSEKFHRFLKTLNGENFVGTNLFDWKDKKCFTTEDIALLITRRDFENLLPKNITQCLLTDPMILSLINYFYTCHKIIRQMSLMQNFRNVGQKAYYDALGGYLNSYLVPIAKYSYYAGRSTLQITQIVLNLQQQCKQYLNTNGNNWKSPIKDVTNHLAQVHIEPLKISTENSKRATSCCKQLEINASHGNETFDDYQEDYVFDDNFEMIVSLPRLEPADIQGHLGNIWLPFKRKKVYNLRSDRSANVLVKFYTTLAKCYAQENINMCYYNKKLNDWLMEHINNHLSDEQFYPGLGAVLRIAETIKATLTDRITEDNEKIALKDSDDLLRSKHSKTTENLHQLQKMEFKSPFSINFGSAGLEGNKDATPHRNAENNLYGTKINTTELGKKQSRVAEAETAPAAAANNGPKTITVFGKQFTYNYNYSLGYIIVAAVAALFLIILMLICCCKCCRWRRKNNVKPLDPEKEALLSADSKSINTGKLLSGSSSSVLSVNGGKFSIKNKKSEPAIIETTSLDSKQPEKKKRKNIFKKPTKTMEETHVSRDKETGSSSSSSLYCTMFGQKSGPAEQRDKKKRDKTAKVEEESNELQRKENGSSSSSSLHCASIGKCLGNKKKPHESRIKETNKKDQTRKKHKEPSNEKDNLNKTDSKSSWETTFSSK